MHKKGPRINEQIRATEIELIDETGQHHAAYNFTAALQRAIDANLSLVEIRFDKIRPVCKIMDYGKSQYEKSKQESAKRKQVKQVKEKEIQISPTIGDNDLMRLIDRAREMLQEGHKLRIVLTFKGRAVLHKNMKNMDIFVDNLKDVSKVFQKPSEEGRKSICRLVPLQSNG